jgi:hypothetical protein
MNRRVGARGLQGDARPRKLPGFKPEPGIFKVSLSMNESGTSTNEAGTQDPMPELRRLLARRSLRSGAEKPLTDPQVEASLMRWAGEGVVCPPVRFQADGDALLVLSGPTSGNPIDTEAILRTTLAGLVLEGVLRSARWCGEGGVLVAAVDGLNPPADDAPGGSPAGVVLQWTPSAESTVVLEQELFGEGSGRVLVTVRGEDAGRVMKQTRILGAEALRVGTVSGSGLVIRFGGSQWELSMADLDSLRVSESAGIPSKR